jgi:hypothetical protein
MDLLSLLAALSAIAAVFEVVRSISHFSGTFGKEVGRGSEHLRYRYRRRLDPLGRNRPTILPLWKALLKSWGRIEAWG